MAQHHVRESIRELDSNTWVVGNRIVLTKTSRQSRGCWSNGEDSFFTVSEAEEKLSRPVKAHPFPLVYDAGDAHAVWKVGEAYMKVMLTTSPDTTREHVTIEAVRKRSIDFIIPEVLFHGEWDGRYCLILTRVPGQTLNEAWQFMDEVTKSDYVTKIADICADLAKWESNGITGVDGKHLPECFLTGRNSLEDFRPSAMLQACQDIAMDCSSFVFYHCDLGPTNIIVDLERETVGIIDWECVGFVPREWIRTKFRVCAGMDFENAETAQSPNTRHEWRSRMQKRMGEKGFSDCADKWMEWRGLG